ncbi:MAG TPA: hypothetical protein VHU61_04900 [Solirubrobacteraceae bacterium]|nr:hypothetical protein [Solirubrobacteraceae bacterium]
MRALATVAGVTVMVLGGTAGVAAGSYRHVAHPSVAAVIPKAAQARSPRTKTLVSVRLAALGSSVTSPRGPYRARPTKLAFDLGGYYGAETNGLWIDHLKWVDWGQPVAYASGLVHARVWPGHSYVTKSGGLMLDQLRSCGTKPGSYYTSASMDVPDGFPQNTESTATAISEQALTPC